MIDPSPVPRGAWRAINPTLVLEKTLRDSRPGQSVCVAVSLCNYAAYIEACLDSVHAQTHPDLELIVVDDASGDDQSLALAEGWLARHADRFERVLLLRQPINQGCAAARNAAFLRACSDFVFVLDADNMLYPRAVARLHEVLGQSGHGAAYSQLEYFGQERRLGQADLWSPKLLAKRNYIDAMALVAKRAWQTIGGYDDFDAWADYDFWCKFVEHDLAAVFVPEILCRYRVHGASMLRADGADHNELIVEMSLRHPWLELKAVE